MEKLLKYSLGVLYLLSSVAVQATEKFDVLPDLPDPLAYAVQPVQAAAVSGASDVSALGAQSIGHEPSIISVVISLAIVILLIYLTGIIYAKLNKVGFKTIKRHQSDYDRTQVSVLSTTQLGNNKTLHVVELDGKRMLIGASSGAIQLIKDLGDGKLKNSEEEYSSIEIPNIKIPKIEIPKIEIPTINFAKLMTKTHKAIDEIEKDETSQNSDDSITQSEKQEDINPEGIIDSLFTQNEDILPEIEQTKSEHSVDPDDFALYKKYLS